MDAKIRFFVIWMVVSMLVVSCGGARTATQAPATESPAATQPPAATETPATEQPTSVVPASNLVVILVVDTFSSLGEDSNPPPTPAPDPNGNCSATPDGQQYGGHKTPIPSALTILGNPHGRYVYNDVIHQIESYGFTLQASDPSGSGLSSDPTSDPGYGGATSVGESFVKRVDLYLNEENPVNALLIVAVDTTGLDFNAIDDNIPSAIDYFSTDHNLQFGDYHLPGAKNVVVNMSFVFVPCDPDPILQKDGKIKELLIEYKLNTAFDNFDSMSADQFTVKYLADQYDPNKNKAFYDGVNSIKVLTDLRSRLAKLEYPNVDNSTFNAFVVNLIYDPAVDPSWIKSFDELQDKLKSFNNVVYVGAAGNFEYPYPFAPASWGFVISVSSDGSTSDSNCRKDVADYSNCGEVKLDGVYYDDTNIVGTSFAAPKVSARAALNLLLTKPSVIGNSCPMNFNTPTLPTGPWSNAAYNCSP
jgi:hypothetical protein